MENNALKHKRTDMNDTAGKPDTGDRLPALMAWIGRSGFPILI